MHFDLDALEVLEAIVDRGTFAGAARRLHRTQSAVSYAVAKLEEGLGVELFDRSGHRATLTAAGAVILDEGRALLHRARRLEALAGELRGGWEPELRVVLDGILPVAPLMSALREFAADTIPTRVQVKMEFLGGVQYRFEAEGADLMVVKDWQPSRRLRAHPLAPIEVVLVCGAEHPLAGGGDRSTLVGKRSGHPGGNGAADARSACTKVDAERVVESGGGPALPGGAGALPRAALQEHVELTIQDSSPSAVEDARVFGGARVFWLSDFHAKREALRAGLGFGWMPEELVRDDLARGALVEVPLEEGSRYSFTPMAVHRADRPLGPAGRRLLDAMVEAMG